MAHIATKYYVAADMARDGEIDLSYIPTADMLADCLTNPLWKPAFLKQFAAVGLIRIGLANGLANGLDIVFGIGRGNCLWNGHQHGMGTGNGIRNGVAEKVHWAHLIRGDPRCMNGFCFSLLLFCFKQT